MTAESPVVLVGQVGTELHILVEQLSGATVAQEMRPGGCAYFGAVALSRLGCPPTVITNTGASANAEWIRDSVGPLCSTLVDVASGQSDYFESRWDTATGEKMLVCSPGTGLTLEDLTKVKIPDEASVVVYSNPDPEFYLSLMALLVRPGRMTVVVPNQTLARHLDVLMTLCGLASTIILNSAEAQEISGQASHAAAVLWFRSLKRTCEIIITDGLNGVVVIEPEDGVVAVEHTGPTALFGMGTGDMLAAAYALYRVQGQPSLAAVQRAVRAAAEAAEIVAPFRWRHGSVNPGGSDRSRP